jgi:hypothetical protein
MQPAEKVTYKLNFGYYTSFKNSRLMRITEMGNFSELLNLAAFFSETDYEDMVLRRYVLRADNICEFVDRAAKYPGIIVDESDRAKKYINNFKDVLCYHKNYPAISHSDEFEILAITYIDSYGDLKSFVKTWKQTKKLDDAIEQMNAKPSIEEYCDLYLIVIDQVAFINEENKTVLHERMFAEASSFKDFNHIATTLSVYAEEAILASVDYIESYDNLITANGYNVLSKSKINSIIERTYKNYSFKELIDCSKKFPDYPIIEQLAERSLDKANTIENYYAVYQTYPQLKDAAEKKAADLTEGSLERSQKYFDLFPAENSNYYLGVALDYFFLTVERFNELMQISKNALSDERFEDSEDALEEAQSILPNDNYIPELEAAIAYHNEQIQAYNEELERQRRIADAQPWEYNGIIDEYYSEGEKITIGTIQLIKPSGRTIEYEFYYHHKLDSEDTQLIEINGKGFYYSPKYDWITNHKYGHKNYVTPDEAIKWAAEAVANY